MQGCIPEACKRDTVSISKGLFKGSKCSWFYSGWKAFSEPTDRTRSVEIGSELPIGMEKNMTSVYVNGA